MIKLNLLPPAQQDYLHYERIYLYCRRVALLFLTFTVFISGILLGARLLLQDNFSAVLTSNNNLNGHDYGIEQQISNINRDLRNVQTIQANFVKWSELMVDLSRVVPPNVQLSYLDLEQNNHTFNLTGLAAARDDYLKLQANLEQLPYLKNVSSPLTNLLQRTNVNFQFTGTFNPPPSSGS